MAEFTFYAQVTVSAYTVVEAPNVEEARRIAERRSAAIGGLGTGNEPDEYWVIEEADGEPEGIHLEGEEP